MNQWAKRKRNEVMRRKSTEKKWLKKNKQKVQDHIDGMKENTKFMRDYDWGDEAKEDEYTK